MLWVLVDLIASQLTWVWSLPKKVFQVLNICCVHTHNSYTDVLYFNKYMAVNISHIGMPGRHSGCKRRPSNFSRVSFSTVLQVSHRSLGEEVRRLRAVLFINSADKTKLSCSTPSDSAPQFLKKITSLFISAWSKSGLQSLVLGHLHFCYMF